MRSWTITLLLLLLLLPAAAEAQDGLATIRIEQQGPAGETILGGCYEAVSDDYSRERCDIDDGASDGVVTVAGLRPGSYDVSERQAPRGYERAADFSVSLDADETERQVRRHDPTPRLHVVTTDDDGKPLAGSCWWVRVAGDTEGYFDACDAEDGADDGTTTFFDLTEGEYSLIHISAPDGIDRVDDSAFTMPGQDRTLTFKLEPAVAPENTVPPAIGGGHAAGDELTGVRGTWTGSREIELMDAWERCEADGSGCVDAGDYDEHYTIAAEDAGKALRYRVRAVNDGGRRTAYSALHEVSSLAAPEAAAPPKVTGSTTLGQKLTADPGTWTNAPTFSYQWQRCTAGACADIANATGATYTTVKADADKQIRVVVTAANEAGHASATSSQTWPIDDDPYVVERPSTSGTPAVGETMTAYPGHWITHYGNLELSYRWLRCDADDETDCEAVGYGDTYRIQTADEGFSVLVEVTAADAGGAGHARSNPRRVPTLRPINVSPPTFSGKQRLGEELSGQIGQWTSGDGSRLQFSFSWQRCDADGAACVTIPGQPNNIFAADHTIVAADLGHRLRLQVRARNSSGERYAYSALTGVLALQPPVDVSAPTFSGRVRLGLELQGYKGEWSYDGAKLRFAFSWQRCEADGTRCVTIPGQPNNIFAADHTIVAADLGHRLRLQVGAQTPEGETYAYSELTEVVQLHPPVNVSRPAFPGRVRLGLELQGYKGEWSYDGAGQRFTFSWQRCEADGTRCVTIPSQPNNIFAADHTIVAADLGHRLRLQVGDQTPDGTIYAYSELTELVQLHPPVNVSPPTFTGGTRVGDELDGYKGEWSYDGSKLRHTFSWQRCDAGGGNCTTIPGQPDNIFAADHKLVRADAGRRLRLRVGAETPDGTVYAYSAPTAVIAA